MNKPLKNALIALTNRPGTPGIDWAELDRHRLTLAEIAMSHRILCNPDSSEAESIEGLLSGLDWLTDLAEEAGLFKRRPLK